MSRIEILKYPDPMLCTKCSPSLPIDSNYRVQDILDLLTHCLLNTPGAIGLSAPQIGIPKRVFVVRIPGDVCLSFVNPEILARSNELVRSGEACLSIPNRQGVVLRAKDIYLQFEDMYGGKAKLFYDGDVAFCIQHEMDHLDGILFIDKLIGK